jgi:predicted transcriptional regulator
MRRDKVLETINELPKEFDLELLMEKLVFIDKVEKGLKQVEEGKTTPHSEVKAKIQEWRK